MKSKFPKIRGLKHKGRRVIKGVRAFDIETDGLGGDFLAVGWHNEGGPVGLSEDWFYFLENVLLQDTASLWTAHNMGGYESLYFFEEETAEFLLELGWECEAIGPKGRPCLLILTRADETIKVWDSYSLIRMSLKDATALFNAEHVKLAGEIDFDNETFDLSNERHAGYLRSDVLSLQELCYAFRDYFIGAFGVEPGYSLPSSGVKAWRKTMPGDTEYRNITSWGEERIRNAYRGGRVIVRNSHIHRAVDKYDFNSMYPAIMRDRGVPVGPDDWSPRPIPDRPGYLHLLVDIPRDTPPHRCVLSDNDKRFPTGVFETWCTSEEWKQAELWGATQLDFIEGIYFDRLENVFGEFVDKCEMLRATAKAEGKKPLEKLVKLTQNSLYGKFGQKRDVLSVKISRDNIGLPIDTINGGLSDYVYEVPTETASNEIMPHWAAWITAESRLKLCREIDNVSDYFVYADTDSILVSVARIEDEKTNTDAIASGYDLLGGPNVPLQRAQSHERGPTLPTGERYGQLKYEGRVYDFFTIAPKTYSGFVDGEHVSAAKGIPRVAATRANLCAARNGDKVTATINTVRSIKASVRYGKELKITRSFPTPQSSRQYKWESGEFRPPHSGLVYNPDHATAAPEYRSDSSEVTAGANPRLSKPAAPAGRVLGPAYERPPAQYSRLQ